MSRRLILDPDALRDLDDIFDYLAQRNSTAATRYVRELRERCVLYADTPFLIGQGEPDVARRLGLPPEQVRSFPYRNHRCYYVITDDAMRVLGFIDMRRDLDAELEERFPA